VAADVDEVAEPLADLVFRFRRGRDRRQVWSIAGVGLALVAGQPQPSLTLEKLGERGRPGGLLRPAPVRLTKRPLPRRFVGAVPRCVRDLAQLSYVVLPWIQTHVPSVVRVRIESLTTGIYDSYHAIIRCEKLP